MNNKIEIAKLATQLTLSIVDSNSSQRMSIVHAEKSRGADQNTPDVLLVFDALYRHLQTRLGEQ